jgi:hypothetical protein
MPGKVLRTEEMENKFWESSQISGLLIFPKIYRNMIIQFTCELKVEVTVLLKKTGNMKYRL